MESKILNCRVASGRCFGDYGGITYFIKLGLYVSSQWGCLTSFFFLGGNNYKARAAGEGDKWQKGPRGI